MTKPFRLHLRRQTTLCAAFITVFALSFIAPSIARAQATSAVSDDISNRVSNGVSAYMPTKTHRQNSPAPALLVSRGGKIVQAEGFGLANVELQVPVKPETVFQSGSVGKQFTAMAAMSFIEEDK